MARKSHEDALGVVGAETIIGAGVIVQGNLIKATNITVAGQLIGNITADGEATIRETGHVKGDIKAAGLAVVSGGVFIGRSLMEAPTRLHTPDSTDSIKPQQP
jgi:cytoskeletal protein CcmA (bactofilin family)